MCFSFYSSRIMAKNTYEKVSSGEKQKTVSFLSLLFFQWMNSVFKIGSKRPLEQNDFLPLPKGNISSSLIKQLLANWNNETAKCKVNGRRPKLWKSVIKMLSFKETMFIIFASALYSLSRIIQPLFLGYLTSTLMSTLVSTEPQTNYLLYACAVAMGVNALIGCLSMHHVNFRCELLSNRLSSSLKGLVYLKVSVSVLLFMTILVANVNLL